MRVTFSHISCLPYMYIVQPFFDSSHKLQDYFPDRTHAYMIPTMIIILIITVFLTFIGLVLISSPNVPKK